MAHQIRSPLPGSFYRRPAPDQPPFKEVGDVVAVGDTIALVYLARIRNNPVLNRMAEVMKTFHEVKADASGTIASFDVEDAEPVTPGQVLVSLS